MADTPSFGSAKESSGPSESEASSSAYGSSSSSGDGPPWPPDGSEGSSSSSSSCQCGFEVTEIHFDFDSITAGEFTVVNTGCGPITVSNFISSVGGELLPALPVVIPEGGFQVFHYEGEGDIRGVFLTVVTDCGEPVTEQWPLS